MAGLWFEEFAVGEVFDHPLRRTVTETDNLLMSTLTHNPAPLHLDAEYMKGTEYGRILVNSCFTLGLMVGISVNDTTQGTAVANLGWDEVRFPQPIFVGDTLRIETEVLATREQVAPRPGHRHIRAPCLQSGRRAGRALQADVLATQTAACYVIVSKLTKMAQAKMRWPTCWRVRCR